jgi:SecD/SecF fusion protein
MAGSIYVVATHKPSLGLDIQGGMRVVLRAQAEKGPGGKISAEQLETIKSIIDNRVNALGVSEPIVYTKPDANQIIVELPGLKNKEDARGAIQTTAKLEFRSVPEFDNNTWHTEDEMKDGKKTGYETILGPDGKPVSEAELGLKLFKNVAFMGGEELMANSRADVSPEGGAVIHFEVKDASKKRFEQFTRSHIGKRLAIFLDNKLISAPNIEDVIPGIGIIRGNFTIESAKILAGQLNAGALPVPLEWQSDYSVEATLGKQAVQKTLFAGIIGLVIVLLAMLWWYRLPGLLADMALCLYTLFSLAIFFGAFAFLGIPAVTLTVPGIAGFILSIGMAVDANILIFERMKEERATGKSMRASIEAGFKRAFTAILDSNVCTLITCGILGWLGSGPVRGFAVTLAIGVLVSMFTAITCSRTFLLMLAGAGGKEDLFKMPGGAHPRLQVVKNMKLWFGVSAALIVPGIIFLGLGGLKSGIEFTGGTEIGVTFAQPTPKSTVDDIMAKAGHKEGRVLMAEGNQAYITTKLLTQDEQSKLKSDLQAAGARIDSSSTVSGAISKELTRNAFIAVLLASLTIALYLAMRFALPNLVEGLKFGACAVTALLHDVLVVIGAFAIFGYFLNWQVDSLFVTAMLTVVGFSVHDSIIIFDRIRENMAHRQRGESFADVTDRSIEQTFSRSIRTSGTVVITLAALLIFGGPVTRLFVTALLIGIVSGTYSSIFNASPMLVLWKRRSDLAAAAAADARPSSKPGSRTPSRPAARPTPQAHVPKPATASGPSLSGADGTDESDAAKALKASKKRKRRM